MASHYFWRAHVYRNVTGNWQTTIIHRHSRRMWRRRRRKKNSSWYPTSLLKSCRFDFFCYYFCSNFFLIRILYAYCDFSRTFNLFFCSIRLLLSHIAWQRAKGWTSIFTWMLMNLDELWIELTLSSITKMFVLIITNTRP